MQMRTKGIINAIISSASFGLIPLYAIPLMSKGMTSDSILVYRFIIGAILILALILAKGISLRITWGDALRIIGLSTLYTGSALCLFASYHYMSGGVATTLIFTYPVWTAIFTAIILHRFPGIITIGAIITAFVGVAFLSGLTGGVITSYVGPLLAILSGVSYSLYMVIFPLTRIRNMGVLKLNFYIFVSTTLLLTIYAFVIGPGLPLITDSTRWGLLILLGIIPTVISNLALIRALNQTDSTTVAVLGAFEPLTAMLVGLLFLDEPLTWRITLGFGLVLAAVVVLIIHPAYSSTEKESIDVTKHLYPTRRQPSKRYFFWHRKKK